ncbi:XRE family transcriptional regulator [Paenarthrobacter sp. NPDC089675]|uniref:XRE family transcriptional regulator n=1 Tax=Paenarthrobacter sp. NPDC089675 TaxID=3364376 RepID=UPI0037F93ED7
MTLEPSRITLARLRAGISKAQLAERLDATSRTITNYETHGAPDRMAAPLAMAIGCQPSFLSLPPAAPVEEDRVFFRARRRSSAAQKHAATSAARTGVELYSFLLQHFALPDLSIPDLAPLEPRQAAQQLRAEWGLGIDPLPNLVRLAEAHGVRVLTLPDGAKEVDAFSLWEDGVPFVFLSTMKTAERSRFDLAHELGHLVLHAGLDMSLTSERNAEKEADQFASELLMPRVLLRSMVGREPSVESLLRLKAHLGVSAMALAYAFHKGSIYSDWSFRQACIELSRRGYRSGEPDGMLRETSRVFAVVLPALRRSKGGPDEIARHLGISSGELHGLTFGQALSVVGHQVPDYRPKRSDAHLSLVL